MQIIIDSRTLTKDIGSGVGWYTKQLIESLIKYTDLEVWAWYNAFQEDALHNILPKFDLLTQPIKITHWPNRLLNFFWNSPMANFLPIDLVFSPPSILSWATKSLRSQEKCPSIFHAPSPFLGLPPARKIKKVVTVHDLTFLTHPETHSDQDLKMSKIIKKTVERADAIIAVSKNTKKDLVELLNVPKEKIFVIYEAPREKFKIQNSKFKIDLERLGIYQSYFLYVGNLEPRKNLVRLVKTYEQFLSHISAISPIPLLVLAGGKAWKSDEITKTVENSPVRDKIILTGYVNDNNLLILYNNAQALFYVPLYEGFGLPVLEALACGCPVVTSNTSSLPEVGGEVAEYVDPENIEQIAQKMVAVANWPQEARNKKQAAGLSWAKNFTWEKVALETREVYQSLFQGPTLLRSDLAVK